MNQDTAFYSLRTWVVLQNDTSKRREDALVLPTLREIRAGFISFCAQRCRSAGRPRTAFAATPLLFAEPIAETAYGFDHIAGLAEFFA